MKIAIIDYDIGNVRSIINAFENFSIPTILTRNKNEIMNSSGLVLPGVGSFASGMKNLSKYSLNEVIHEFSELNRPILGICLGMQILMEGSTEFGYTKGLGLIKGQVDKIQINDSNTTKLPNIGWSKYLKLF